MATIQALEEDLLRAGARRLAGGADASRSSATWRPDGCRSSRSWCAARPARYLHHNFVVALLNDLFGIQTRGGCSCAGPYGHRLLGIDLERSHQFEAQIATGCEGIKPGLGAGELQLLPRRGGLRLPRRGGADGGPRRLAAAAATTGSTPTTGLWHHRGGPVEPPLRLADVHLRRRRHDDLPAARHHAPPPPPCGLPRPGRATFSPRPATGRPRDRPTRTPAPATPAAPGWARTSTPSAGSSSPPPASDGPRGATQRAARRHSTGREAPLNGPRGATQRAARRHSSGEVGDHLGAGELGEEPAGDQQLGAAYAGADDRDRRCRAPGRRPAPASRPADRAG